MLKAKCISILFILLASIPCLFSFNQNASEIESMMETAERNGLSVTFNRIGRSLPLLFNPFLIALVSQSAATAFTIGILYSVSVWLLSILFPKLFAAIGLNNGLVSLRSARSPLMPEIDFEAIAETVKMLPEKLMAYLNIPEEECRYRAVCESATFIVTKIPLINDWVKKMSGALFLNIANPYSKAWINGMMQTDCAIPYAKCKESPFRSIVNKFVMRR